VAAFRRSALTVFREFSASEDLLPRARTVYADAPHEFRNELIDLVFSLADTHMGEAYFYRLMTQNIGASVAGNPYGGYRYAIGRDLGRTDWVRVYDLLPRLADEFRRAGLFEEFRGGLNRILAGNAVAWDMDEKGKLVRVLPEEASTSVRVAVRELAHPQFKAAHKLLLDAIDAYNAYPQRPRDACANVFDAVESAGKVVTQLPTGTFGDVLNELRRRKSLSPETLRMLKGLETMRHNHFGHGMSEPFSLPPQEVDFVYLACVAAAILFARISRL
jgi:hypothetical protein